MNYKDCVLCSKKCHINREKNIGPCGANNIIKVARASLHFWEEPIISGDTGSGTVFFSNCNLKCVFCQNREISSNGIGKEISIDRLSDIFIELQNKGANNINLVTPTHYLPSIVEGLKIAKEKGLSIPIVYNTSSYENIDILKELNGFVDIYLADLKYYNNELGKKYSKVDDYFDIASANIQEMFKQVGKPVIKNGLMKKGIIVRVLVLPKEIEDAKKIVKYLYEKYNDNIYISIMNQYTPVVNTKYENLNRSLSKKEYDEVVKYALDLGIKKAFIQEGETNKESFIPNFNFDGV